MPADPDTLVSLFYRQAQRLGDRGFLRFKVADAWQELTWAALAERVDDCADALAGLGVSHGDRVAILSENRLEWIVSDLGLMTAGGVNVPIHTPMTARQVAYQVGNSGAAVVFVSTTAQLDKLVACASDCPAVSHVIAYDKVDPPSGTGWTFHRFGDLVDGEKRGAATRDRPVVGPDDLATIMYTSGTTGDPKGVMLTHGNLVSNAKACLDVFEVLPEDVRLNWLPISHIFARTADYYATMAAGSVLVLAEGYERLMDDLQAVHPSLISSVPHFYENVVRELTEQGLTNEPDALRDLLGGNMRLCVSGGAPLPPHLATFFNERNVPVVEGYGLTETSPVISSNRPHANKVGTVGQPIRDIEVRIADDGEILTRGPHVMRGYWNDPKATAETIVDGWLYTGDLGTLDADGFLSITGRKKEIIVTAGGKNIAPRYIEHLLTEDPLIDQAVIFGDRRKFLTAVIVPNRALLSAELDHAADSRSTPEALVAEPAAYAVIEQRVAAALKDVSRYEQIGRFVLAAQPLTIDSGHLTPTLKIRREKVYATFANQIDALYAASTDEPVN